MPMSSLPSPYGIGTMGKAAYDFVDFVHASGQKYWQLLPLGPTSYGDSPYTSPSTFAGNPYYIDLDMLIEQGLLEKSDVDGMFWGDNPARTDYGAIFSNRFTVLRKAFENGRKPLGDKLEAFRAENSSWVDNYALFMSVKSKFGMKSWIEWPDENIRRRTPEAVAEYTEELAGEMDFWIFTQYLFFEQWNSLRAYAKEKGIGFIGDVPIYVAMDSADVWSEPQFFQLDSENFMPTEVSGVPPDDFNDDGQLWGNPLYDYDAMKADGFGWWIRRIEGVSRLYDVIRIDHFRGFESYWAVPFGETTAKNGTWRPGPGMDLVGVLTGWFPNIEFIAEDLGYPTPGVKKLLDDSGLPGMKVLQFAFDAEEDNAYLPHNCPRNSTMYTGTHDNDTVLGWLETFVTEENRRFAEKYMHITPDEGWCYGFIRTGMASASKLFVVTMQDVLELSGDSRMNTPGIPMGNWTWRMLPGAADDKISARLRNMTRTYKRL